MDSVSGHGPKAENAAAMAARFRSARLSGGSLAEFPGDLPRTLAAAYQVQDAAISAWPDRLIGWKVAGIAPENRARFGAERLAGPAFAADSHDASAGGVPRFEIFPDGFAAVEAEFIFRIGAEIPLAAVEDADLLALHVGALHAGLETAGSPLASINEIGPPAVIADFGNNKGLILGPAIADWQRRPPESLTTRSFVNGKLEGEGSAARVSGGPLAALAFLVRHLAARNRRLQPGDLVSTGMTTGIHAVRPGDKVRAEFVDGNVIEAIAEPARPRPAD